MLIAGPGGEPVAAAPAAPSGAPMMAAGAAPAAGAAASLPSNDVLPNQAFSQMLAVLSNYLPPGPPLLPASVSVLSVVPRSVGLSGFRGNDRRGVLAPVALKGGRLEALVRFDLSAATLPELETAVRTLQGNLLAARDELWAAGVQRISGENTGTPQPITQPDGWRNTVDYRLLYEFHYEQSDGEGLIARIPVRTDLEHPGSLDAEMMLITDEMARWDPLGAPPLALRGPVTLRSLAALVFIPAAGPSGAVTVTRTFDGAVGAPASHPTFPAFLAAISGPAAERHAQVSFPSLDAFLALFTASSGTLLLGDWNGNGISDGYHQLSMPLDPSVRLPTSRDRLEIAHGSSAVGFDQVAILYLRAFR